MLLGGASLVGGYLAASVLHSSIGHHALPGPAAKGTPCNCAALKSPPNTLNCSAVSNCVGICGLTSELQVCKARAASKSGQTFHIPTGVGTATQQFPDVLGTSTPGGDPCSANCGPSLSDPICNLNKVFSQCGGFNAECIPGVPIPCGIIFIGGAVAVALFLLKR